MQKTLTKLALFVSVYLLANITNPRIKPGIFINICRKMSDTTYCISTYYIVSLRCNQRYG